MRARSGRVGGKAMLWFVSASLVSLTLGLVLVNLFAPGDGVHKVVSGVTSGIDAHAMTLDGFVKHVFPDSCDPSRWWTTKSCRSS